MICNRCASEKVYSCPTGCGYSICMECEYEHEGKKCVGCPNCGGILVEDKYRITCIDCDYYELSKLR